MTGRDKKMLLEVLKRDNERLTRLLVASYSILYIIAELLKSNELISKLIEEE